MNNPGLRDHDIPKFPAIKAAVAGLIRGDLRSAHLHDGWFRLQFTGRPDILMREEEVETLVQRHRDGQPAGTVAKLVRRDRVEFNGEPLEQVGGEVVE